MEQRRWMAYCCFVTFWNCTIPQNCNEYHMNHCLTQNALTFIVTDEEYSGVINQTVQQSYGFLKIYPVTAPNDSKCFLMPKKTSINQYDSYSMQGLHLVQMEAQYLVISKRNVGLRLCLCTLLRRQCLDNVFLNDNRDCRLNPNCSLNQTSNTAKCSISCFRTDRCARAPYENGYCKRTGSDFDFRNKYIINITDPRYNCYSCNPDFEEIYYDAQLEDQDGKNLDPVKAADFMNNMHKLVSFMNGSLATVFIGNVKGAIVKKTEKVDLDRVSFAYTSSNSSIDILGNGDFLPSFPTSVSVSKEAFEQAFRLSNGTAYAATFRFPNMAKDEINSTVLLNEVLAIEMGATISNLTDEILINFRNVTEIGSASCRSWNGEGSRPNWTENGCNTSVDGNDITCKCSHLTFFAVIMSPLNTTISAADLNSLTYITYVGCGLSLFFLAIGLFRHFLLRRNKANRDTQILVQLFIALFLLNLTFLTNASVADLRSTAGCRVMAAAMHYALLATFTWFALYGLHLCLQIYPLGKGVVRHYMLKLCVAGWSLPSVVVIVLLILGKYGEQVIHTDEDMAFMCWINDSEVQYITNIGYYALVFLFTFTTFILVLRWLCILKGPKAGSTRPATSGSKDVVTIFGLCFMLGVTWAVVFFAHGALRLPAYYVFTILNSFQGFFLFLYYCNTSKITDDEERSGAISSNTTKSTVNTL